MEQRWIPVSERLPEEHDSIFAKWKGTVKWNPAMFEKTSDEVLVTISDVGGKGTTRTAHTLDGKWSCDLLKWNASYKVIAWMPLPEPYRGEEPKQTNADRIRSMTDEELADQVSRHEVNEKWGIYDVTGREYKGIEKKILPEYYNAVISGSKTFELRKDEDNIQSGDFIVLKEWDGKRYTGRQTWRRAKYVLRDVPEYGLCPGYCIVGW